MACSRFRAALVIVAVTVLALAGAAQAVTYTITGTAGGHDSWNDPTNWDSFIVPTGAVDAAVAPGVTAQCWNAATPIYTGSLILNNNSTLQMGWTTNYPESARALGGSGVTMNDGSGLRLRLPSPNPLILPPITMAGDASIHLSPSTSAHHRARNFDGVITGPGALTVIGNNNNTLNLNVASPGWSGGFVADADDSWRVEANVSGAFGTGDVTLNGRPGVPSRGATLQIDATDAIADTAALFLNGGRDHRKAAKLILNADDTIAELWLDGAVLPAGTYDSTSGLTTSNGDSLISGGGTLTVTGGPGGTDNRPPLPNPMTFDAVPHGVTLTAIEMTATEAIDVNAVEYQFERDGSVFSPWQSSRTWTDTGLTQGQAYTYRVWARDVLGNIGLWSDPFSTTPIIENIMIADAGGNDSWLVDANWSAGAPPSGSDSAIIGAGLSARISGTPTPYSGNLDLGANAELYIFGGPGIAVIPTAPAKVILRDGTLIVLRTPNGSGGDVTFPDVELLGDAVIKGGQSTSGHHCTRNFDGVISGPGQLTLDGVNNNTFNLNAANSFDGLIALSAQNQPWRLFANAAGSLGVGDVTINNKVSLIMDAADAIDDSAMLSLNGTRSTKPNNSNPGAKLVLNANDTVLGFSLDGVTMAPGTYDSSSGLVSPDGAPAILGNGVLTVSGIAVTGTAGNWRLATSAQPNELTVSKTATDLDPFDMQITVAGGGVLRQILEDVINTTDEDWADYHMLLGFGLGPEFVPSEPGDGLGFADALSQAFPGLAISEDELSFDRGIVPIGEPADFALSIEVPGDQPFTFTLRQYPTTGDIIPEPATLSLLGLGALLAIGRRRRRP